MRVAKVRYDAEQKIKQSQNERLESLQTSLSPLKHTPPDYGDIDKASYYTD